MIKHIKPLFISEEMLGAYLEGNLSQHAVRYVEQMLQDNDELSAFVEELSVSDNLISNYLLEDMPSFENDCTLPEISTELGTYIEHHALTFGFEPSFADASACTIMPDITDDGEYYDMDQEDSIPINNELDEFASYSNYPVDDYNEDSNIFDNDSINYL